MTEQNDAEESGKSSLKKIILMVLGMFAIAGLSVSATLYLTRASSVEAPEEGPDARLEDGSRAQRVHYLALNPNFVVTYEDNSRQRFLQTELAVAARDQESLDTLTRHMPRVRNNIIQALSERTFDDIRTDAGRQELTAVLTEVLQKIVQEHTGQPGVETVLLSNFVLQ
ncbi:MAG: flagellar basal body-associated FliL family protein [Natronospirillum sp.]